MPSHTFRMSHAIRSLVAVSALVMAASGANAQTVLPFQGILERDGAPFPDTQVEMDFGYFDAATGGTACSTEENVLVDVANGTFSVLLVPADACVSDTLFVEVTVRDGALDPVTFATRQQVHSSATAYASAPDREFVAPLGVVFDAAGSTLSVRGGDEGFPGVSNFGLVLQGPTNGHVMARVAANGIDDAFVVQVAPSPTASPNVFDGNALTVTGNGATEVRELSAMAIDADSVTSDSVSTGAVVADTIEGPFASASGDSGCMRIGDVQHCWGPYTSNVNQTYTNVTFSQPFISGRYAVTCTPNGGGVESVRFCQTRLCNATVCGMRTSTDSGGGSAIGGFYIAIGRWR